MPIESEPGNVGIEFIIHQITEQETNDQSKAVHFFAKERIPENAINPFHSSYPLTPSTTLCI